MANKIFKEVVIWLTLLSFFITGNGFIVQGITFYWYYPLYLMLCVFGITVVHKINLQIVLVMVAMWAVSLIVTNYGIEPVIKQLVNITFSLVALYYVFELVRFDLEYLTQRYIAVSKVVLLLGFIQVALFSIDQGYLFLKVFQFLRESNITFRLQSVCQEPSYAAYVLAPVVFMSMHTLVYGRLRYLSKFWALFFVVGYLLTFSLIAYVGLVLMVIVLYCKNLTYSRLYVSVIVVAGIGFFGLLSYRNISLLRVRVDDTYRALTNDITHPDVYTNVNLSTYALLSNLHVTYSSLKDHPIVGTGLGTYSLAYDHYLPEAMKNYSSISNQDGNSMAFRLLTETGIIGLMFFLFFLFRFKTRSFFNLPEQTDLLWIMNSGILIMAILLLIRHGHYTTQGRIFFFLFYYFAFREYTATVRKDSSPAMQTSL